METNEEQIIYINDDLLCEIVSFMPYFYQWKFKRINSLCFRNIERMQKKRLFERFLSAKNKEEKLYFFGGGDFAANNRFKKEVRLDDFNFVEKHDWIKFRMNSYLENSQSAIALLKQFYYLDDLEWLWEENEKSPLKLSQLDSFSDIRKLILLKLAKKFIFTLSLIGLKRLQEPKYTYSENLNRSIGISIVYFMFCSKKLESQAIETSIFKNHAQFAILKNNDCFTYTSEFGIGLIFQKKANINTIRKANSYFIKCYRKLKVDPSWIPRGNLYHHAMFENNIPNWERIELLYENYLIPMNEILKIPKQTMNISRENNIRMNILQLLFWGILRIAKKIGISENLNYPEGEYVKLLESFQNTPKVLEYKNIMSRLLSHVDERMFILLEMGEFSIVKMVKDFDMLNELNLQLLSQKKYNFNPFKWYDFVKRAIRTESQNPFLIERNNNHQRSLGYELTHFQYLFN